MTIDNETEQQSKTTDSTVNVSELAGALADEQPDVSEHTVQAETAKAEQRKQQYADLKDKDGNSFDPAIHVTDANGEPSTTTTGKLRKRPGRKAGVSTNATPSQIGAPGSTAQNSGQPDKQNPRQAGRHAARMMVGLSVAFGGDEWKPVKDEKHGVDEMDNLESAFGDYFEAKEMEDIPPGIALCIVVGSYAIPRFTMPKTQSRVGRLRDWFAAKWFNYKIGKKGKQKEAVPEKDKEEDGAKGTLTA